MRMEGPHGKIGHAEVQIGDSVIMLADEFSLPGESSNDLSDTPGFVKWRHAAAFRTPARLSSLAVTMRRPSGENSACQIAAFSSSSLVTSLATLPALREFSESLHDSAWP